MITDATGTVTEVLATAASTVASTLAGGEPLTVGDPTREADPAGFGSHAVIAQFSGSRTGDLLLVVADDVATALRDSSLGALDLDAALTPTVEAVAAAIGPVVLGPLQVVETRLGINRILAGPDAALVPLLGGTGPRAAIAISLNRAAASPATTPASEDVQSQRLDLLRGVEMEATVELGRSRMTVNELLSLRSGAVIELDRAAGTPADLFVNGRLIAHGEVVVVDENYGLRITQVITDTQGR